jgi:hypothetical protein
MKNYTINWNKIYNTNFFTANNCWTTCDGYCCKNFYGNYFKIFNKENVVLPMFEDEYDYYKSIGGIKNIDQPDKHVFRLMNNKEFSIYFAKCNQKGMCDPHCSRPLICRIYPYFPLVDLKGNVIGFEYAALLDLFYENDAVHPCTLVREQNLIIKEQLKNSFKDVLENPKFIFMFKLLELISTTVKEAFPMYMNRLNEDEKIVFYKNYENTMLKGRLWKNEKFKKDATYIYEQIEEYYGEFL